MNTPVPTTPDTREAIDADVMEKAREYAMSAVTSMCTTWRHDYGLMPKAQAEALRGSMEQIAYHDVSLAIARAIHAAKDEAHKAAIQEFVQYAADSIDGMSMTSNKREIVKAALVAIIRRWNAKVRPLPSPPQRFTPDDITENLNERHEAGERA